MGFFFRVRDFNSACWDFISLRTGVYGRRGGYFNEPLQNQERGWKGIFNDPLINTEEIIHLNVVSNKKYMYIVEQT